MTSKIVDTELRRDIRQAVAGVTARWGRDYYLAKAKTHLPPDEMYRAMAEQGLFALGVPEDLGGSGGGVTATAAVMEAMSEVGCPPMSFSLTSFARQAIIKHGSPNQIDRFVKPSLTAEHLIAFAVTESDAGTNTFSIQTKAHLQEDGSYRLRGSKLFISGADQADSIMVVARTSQPGDSEPKHRGLTVFMVDRHAAGLSMEAMDIEWFAPEQQFVLTFDDVIVAAEDVVGEPGGGAHVLFESLNAERIVISAWTIGLGDFALAKSLAYANTRAPWGAPIGSYQAVAHPLARAKAQLEAARCLTYAAAASYDEGVPAGAEANMAKLLSSEASAAALDAAIQAHGGSAFDQSTDLVALWPMIRILRIAPLNNEMVLNFISEHVLGLPRSY